MAQRVRLALLDGNGYLTIRSDVPATRGDCPPADGAYRRCGHVRCTQHLAFIAGHDRAGRRVNGRTPDATIRILPANAPHCALDVADQAAIKNEPTPIPDVAAAMGLKASQVHAILARCLEKLRAAHIDPDLDGAWPRAVGNLPL